MKRVVVSVLIVLLLGPLPIQAQDASPTVLTADTKQTVGGVTFVAPKDWSEKREGAVTTLTAPENDARIIIVGVGAVADGKAAVAAAWKQVDPSFDRKELVAMSQAATHGWDGAYVVNYETTPDEHKDVSAQAFRKGTNWTVVLVDGSSATFEKRSAGLGILSSSLQPADYVAESFAGRTAHRLTPDRVAELVNFTKSAMQQLDVPGVGLSLIDHGKIVYDGGLGVRTVGKAALVDQNTLFMIGSNTKGMTTLMLARVVDQGKLRWDEPVTQAYPDFRLGSPQTTANVRIQDLICACTGVPRKDFDMILGTTAQTTPQYTFTDLANTEPTSKYGEIFQYSNAMASAAGYIAGHIEYPNLPLGAAYDKAMQQLVFDPLGMTHTTFDLQKALASDHADGHGKTIDGKTLPIDETMNEVIIPYRPAGEAWSSAHDMIAYVQNELTEGVLPNGKRIISSKNLLQRRAHTVAISKDLWYGMGLMDDRRWGISVVRHGGATFGFLSDWAAIPSANAGIVVLTNSQSGGELTGLVVRRLAEILYDGKPEAATQLASLVKSNAAEQAAMRKLLSEPPTTEAQALLAPSYRSPDLGMLTVTKNGSSVHFEFGMWGSVMASRKNADGTTTFMTASPGSLGLEFTAGTKDGKRTLVTRDGQHVYTYVEQQ